MGGVVESVNVGAPRPVEVNGHVVLTAIWKSPVEGRVPVRGVNLRGDDQADRTVHGGADKAVYAYAAEDEEWWRGGGGRGLRGGPLGGKLTARGAPARGGGSGGRWGGGGGRSWAAFAAMPVSARPCRRAGSPSAVR